MSFSRTFHYHVSGSVRYPASNSGGTVSYSDSVTVTVEVDTRPLDNSVARCVSNVHGLTNTVSSTALATVKEKALSAQKIARSLIGGFFRYVAYGLKEKVVELGSRIPMLLKALEGLAQNCTGARTRLERDYQAITSRYSAIFDDLETSLKTSLRKLDAPAYELSDAASRVLLEPLLGPTSAGNLLAGLEETEAVGAIEVSRMKSLASDVVAEAARNVNYNIRLTNQLNAALHDADVLPCGRVSMPVVVLVADAHDSAGKQCGVHSGAFSPDQVKSVGEAIVGGGGDCPVSPFNSDEDNRRDVESFFKKRLSNFMEEVSDMDRRTRLSNEIMRMWGLACAPAQRKPLPRSLSHG